MASKFECLIQQHARAKEMAKQLLTEETPRFALTYATALFAAVVIGNVSDHDFSEVDQIVDCFPNQLKLACRELYAARFN